jgi:hypothetical protein
MLFFFLLFALRCWQTGGIFGANSVAADFTTDVTSNRVASESEASANGPLAV